MEYKKLKQVSRINSSLLKEQVSVELVVSQEEMRAWEVFLMWVLAAPSEIVRTIEETGRDAILRGSGGSDGMF